MLISLGGQPGVGKSTVGWELAQRLGAMRIRVDVLEQALRDAGLNVIDDQGYRAAYAIAEDNLRLGRTVISDCVNDIEQTRQAWRNVAQRASAPFLEVEIICSDAEEHRRRVETRVSDVPGLALPSWSEVQARKRDPWTRTHIVVDTAKQSAADIAEMLDWPIERARRAFGI